MQDIEGLFFNNMTLVLDRYYVHTIRMLTGKEGTPLNEVEMICDSLMNRNGIPQGSNVVKCTPDQSVITSRCSCPLGGPLERCIQFRTPCVAD
jgi:hypothetical protein